MILYAKGSPLMYWMSENFGCSTHTEGTHKASDPNFVMPWLSHEYLFVVVSNCSAVDQAYLEQHMHTTTMSNSLPVAKLQHRAHCPLNYTFWSQPINPQNSSRDVAPHISVPNDWDRHSFSFVKS
jgi:hypothetical protein